MEDNILVYQFVKHLYSKGEKGSDLKTFHKSIESDQTSRVESILEGNSLVHKLSKYVANRNRYKISSEGIHMLEFDFFDEYMKSKKEDSRPKVEYNQTNNGIVKGDMVQTGDSSKIDLSKPYNPNPIKKQPIWLSVGKWLISQVWFVMLTIYVGTVLVAIEYNWLGISDCIKSYFH